MYLSRYLPKSIEDRSKEANDRCEYGHWKEDLMIDKQGTKPVLFTLTERMTRQEIILKLPNKQTNRTSIYYSHPYCSRERVMNENDNRMIKRWIPKETDITNISTEFVKKLEKWLNNYPLEMFYYQGSNILLLNI